MDGISAQRELSDLRKHISDCPDCALHAHQLQSLRAALRSAPSRQAPARLSTRLRVIASQEAARNRRNSDLHATTGYWRDVLLVWMGNLMRPFALPAVGGLASAVLLFSMISPAFVVHATIGQDVPTILSTEATLKHSSISFGVLEDDVVVDVVVDGKGRMIDYEVPRGQVWQNDPDLRRCIENTLLCTQFTPATNFGQPVSGKIRITVRGNQVEVRG
jgi:hypothetical protein